MSLCYVTPMSHQWHPSQQLSEPLSPSNNAHERSDVQNLSHASSAPSIYGSLSGLTGNIGWPPIPSQAGTHDSQGSLAKSHAMRSGLEPKPHIVHRCLGGSSQEDLRDPICTVTKSKPHEDMSLPSWNEKKLRAEDDDDDDSTASDLGDIAEEQNQTRTAVERQCDKRRMKRFRLTHSQTRFLMAEFARQPHPDAAQRERLSQEIPGLSSRQVQVWFQNRRAKLKRLPPSDRERMMRSRALPENFDRLTAFDSTLPSTPQINIKTVTSPTYRANRETNVLSEYVPSIQHTSNYEEYVLSPHSNSDVVSESTKPLSISKTQSSVSPTDGRIHLVGSPYSNVIDGRQNTPYTQSQSLPTNYSTPPYGHEPYRRLRAGSLASPIQACDPHLGRTRRRSYDVHPSMDRAADPSSFLQRPAQLPFQGQFGHQSPQRDSCEARIQPNAIADCQIQETRSAGFTHHLRVDTSITSHGQLQQQGQRPWRCHRPIDAIRSAPPITTSEVPWSPSGAQHWRGTAYPNPYNSQTPYSTFGSTAEEAVKIEEGRDLTNVPMVSLGLSQQAFGQGAG